MTQFMIAVMPSEQSVPRLGRRVPLTFEPCAGSVNHGRAECASKALVNVRGQRFWVRDPRGDELDGIVDDLHDAIAQDGDIEGLTLMRFLRAAVAENVEVLSFYRDCMDDLTTVATWAELRRVVVDAAARQPPELYFHLLPRAPA